ncbi:hypothetical protein SDC9_68571 [bioreactor metagenome]|uniref:Uncharacterized protein n=1 Tax=bioreactor metagenome TaxID=1076179 RepID=A0A644Y2H0_9ZZZZ
MVGRAGVPGRGASALDRTLGEAGDDLPLEEHHDDDDGDGDHDRGRGDRPGRFLELGRPGEERQRGGHRSRRRGGGQRDAVHEVVPGDEEGDDRSGEHPRRGQRDDHLAERLPVRRAVDLRGPFEIPGDLLEVRGERVDGDRQGQREVRDDQARPGVVQTDPAPQVEQRCGQGDDREDRHPQGGVQDEPLAREVEPGDGVCAERREDHCDRRGDERDPDRVAQRRQEEALGGPREEALVIVADPVGRQEVARRHVG